ncbi:hypothetical protein, partial [Cronobacter sakazakii]|uniref:hypothetical protein n=1 Tax=Cronobacter sakazakii TaxID=28141 RepID=UPI00294B315C
GFQSPSPETATGATTFGAPAGDVDIADGLAEELAAGGVDGDEQAAKAAVSSVAAAAAVVSRRGRSVVGMSGAFRSGLRGNDG